MPVASDGQTNFLGGMRDNISPELLAENEYAFGENIELRNGRPETRRGSWRILEDNGTGLTQGAGIFCDLVRGREFVMIAQDEKIFRVGQDQLRVEMPTPEPLTGNEIRFLQALDRLYIFRGEGLTPFRWSGDTDDDIVVVPNATGANLSTMPGSNRVLYAYNRFWVITDNDTLNASDLLSEEFDLTFNSFKVTQGDGQKLIAVHPFGSGKLIAFKARSIAIISNANNFTKASDDLTLEFIDDEVGCDSQDSIVSIGKDIFFKSIRGFYTLLQTSEQNAQLIDVPLSEPITDLIERIDQSQAGKTQAVQFDNYYVPAIPIDGGGDPNAIYAFDLELKRWVSIWQIVDSASTDDDGFWRHSRLLLKTVPKLKLMSVGLRGGLAELLRGRHKDLVPSQNVFLTFDDSDSDRVDASAVISGSSLLSQTTGIFEFDFTPLFLNNATTPIHNSRYIDFRKPAATDPVTGSDAFLRISASVVLFPELGVYVGVGQVRLQDGTGNSWQVSLGFDDDGDGIARPEDGLIQDVRRFIRVTQDGSGPVVTMNGKPTAFPPVIAGTGTALWLSALTGATILDIGSSTNTTAMDLFRLGWKTLTGTAVAFFPLNEGSGTTIRAYEDVAGQSVSVGVGTFDAAPADPVWSGIPSAASDISSKVITRGYSFGQLQLYKKIMRGLVKMTHMDPNITISVLNNEPFDDETLRSNITFDETKYDIAGIADWVPTNVNQDFETPFRERYAPVNMGTVGIFVKDTTGEVTMDQIRERSQFLRPESVAKWFQLDISSSRDMIGVTATVLDGQTKNLSILRDV